MNEIERQVRLVVRLPGRAAVQLVRLYQRDVSPMRPPTCKDYPSC